MDVILIRLDRINKLLGESNLYIKTIKKSNWYAIYASDFKREKDLNLVKYQINRLLKIKYSILETLQQKAEIEKASISYSQRSLTIN